MKKSMNSRNCWMPSTQQRKVKPLEGVVYLRKSGNIHGRMKLATWILSGVRNSVPKPGSNKNTQQPIFHVLRELFTSCGPLRRGITWRLQGAPYPQLLSFGLWLVSDVQRKQSCYWVDKLLAPYTHLHNAYLPILMWKRYHRPIGAF